MTRHADVLEASSDPSRFCSSKGILVDEIGTTYDSPPTMMHADPPEHTRYRKLARPGFTNAVVRGLEPMVRERTGRLLDALAVKAADGAVVDVTDGAGGAAARSSSSRHCSGSPRATSSVCSAGPRRPSRAPPTGRTTSAWVCSAR